LSESKRLTSAETLVREGGGKPCAPAMESVVCGGNARGGGGGGVERIWQQGGDDVKPHGRIAVVSRASPPSGFDKENEKGTQTGSSFKNDKKRSGGGLEKVKRNRNPRKRPA